MLMRVSEAAGQPGCPFLYAKLAASPAGLVKLSTQDRSPSTMALAKNLATMCLWRRGFGARYDCSGAPMAVVNIQTQ